MDTISIRGMMFHGKHGVAEHEKEYGNDFEVDVIIHADLSRPAETDHIKDAFDYARIHQITGEVIMGSSVELIERLTFLIGSRIESEFKAVSQFEVRVRKLHPPVDHRTKYTEARMEWPR